MDGCQLQRGEVDNPPAWLEGGCDRAHHPVQHPPPFAVLAGCSQRCSAPAEPPSRCLGDHSCPPKVWVSSVCSVVLSGAALPRTFQTSLSREHLALSLCCGSASAPEMRELQVTIRNAQSTVALAAHAWPGVTTPWQRACLAASCSRGRRGGHRGGEIPQCHAGCLRSTLIHGTGVRSSVLLWSFSISRG